MAFGLRIPSLQDVQNAAGAVFSLAARPFVAVGNGISKAADVVQRNAWYIPSDIQLGIRRDLLELESALSANPIQPEEFRAAFTAVQESYRKMRIQLATFNDYYALSNEETASIADLARYLQLDPNTLIQRGQQRAGFKLALGKILALSERWGEAHGPLVHAKKRYSNVSHRFSHRQTDAERQCELLLTSLSRQQGTPERVQLLVQALDDVIHERCQGGIGSDNVRELSSLLLLQGNLENELLQDALNAHQVAQIAQNAPTHLIRRGYRQNLTLREPPRLIDDTRAALTRALDAPDQFPRDARPRIGRLLSLYADRDPSVLAPLRAVAHADAPSRDQLQTAGEAVAALGTQELGLFRGRLREVPHEKATIGYDPWYNPPQEIVDASIALNRFARLSPALQIAEAPRAALQLQRLLAWLRQHDEGVPFTAYFYSQIEGLIRLLSASAALDENQKRQFESVRKRLDIWGKPSRLERWILGTDARPSMGSAATQPLIAAFQTAEAVSRSFEAQDDQAAIQLLPRYRDELARLREELPLGYLPIDEVTVRLFERSYQLFLRALATPNWNQQEGARGRVIKHAKTLASTLKRMVDSGTTKTFAPAAQAPRNPAERSIFRAEFDELRDRLTGLDRTLQSGNSEEILAWTRSVWSFTRAMLEQNEGNLQRIAEYYHLPLRTIEAFDKLDKLLERAIILRERGSCNLLTPQFAFGSILLEDNSTLSPLPTEDLRRQVFRFLNEWKLAERTQGLLDTSKQIAYSSLVGEAPKTFNPPKPPRALLERANALLTMSLSDAEVLRESILVLPHLRHLTVAQKSTLQRPLLQLLSPDPDPASMGRARATLAAALLYLREEDDRQKALELEREESARPLDTRGLLGKGLNQVMNVAENVGLTNFVDPRTIQGALKTVAGAVNHRVHRTPGQTTGTPASSRARSGVEGVVKSAIRKGAGYLHLNAATVREIETAAGAGISAIAGAAGTKRTNGDATRSSSPSTSTDSSPGSRTRTVRDEAAALFELHAETEEAANFNITGSAKKVTSSELTAEKDLFVQNNSAFVPMKVLYEYVAGLSSQSTEFYGELIQKARAAGPSKEYDVLKQAFIEELDKAGVNILLSSIISWILFPIFYSLSKTYFQLFADRGLEWAKDFIEKNNKDASSAFSNRVVDRTNRALATLQSAYRRIGENQNIRGNLEDELQAELVKPQFNHGMTQEQVHQASADALIDLFVAPGVLQWSRSLREACAAWHPFKEGIADTVLNGVSILLSWVASFFIFPVEWVLRLFTLAFVKRYIVNGNLVGTLVGASAQSIESNGYTHALNCVLYDQLKDVYMMLQRHYSVGPKDGPENADEVDLRKYTIVDRDKLRTLVKELFSILEKHRCRTPEELRRLIHSDSFVKNLQGEVENWAYDKVTSSIENILRAILCSVLKKDQLENQFYQLMTTINGIYKKGQTIPVSEFQKKEDEINRIIEAILALVIDKSFEQITDLNREHEQKDVNIYAEELVALAKELDKDFKRAFRRLNHRVEMNGGKLPFNPKTEESLREMEGKATNFLNKLMQWRNKVQSAETGLSGYGREALIGMAQNLREQVDNMIRSLNAIYKPRAKISLGSRMSDYIEQFKEFLAAIIAVIAGEKQEKQRDLSGKLRRLHDIVRDIERQPALNAQASILKIELERLETLIQNRKAIEQQRNSAPDEDLEDREDKLQKAASALEDRCHKALDACSFDEEVLADRGWEEVQQGMQQLEEWIKTPPAITLNEDPSFYRRALEFGRPLVEKGIDGVKGLVVDRVRNKSDGLLSLIRDPIIWHHAVYNHNILFPLIGKG